MSMEVVVPVSVVIPCYRCAGTIERAVNSVVSQTWRPAEVILVDDCSNDDTPMILENLQRRYANDWIKVILRQVNGGPGATRNDGWNTATQPYIAFLDADDAWHPRKLEVQMGYMLSHPEISITGHRCIWLSSGDRSSLDYIAKKIEDYRVIRLSFWKLLWSNKLITCTVVLKRDLPHRFNCSKRFSEDYLLWLSILTDGHQGALIDLPLAFIYKPPYGAGGLSGDLWKMEMGELANYWEFYRKGRISLPLLFALTSFSLAKYMRRVLKSRCWAWLWRHL